MRSIAMPDTVRQLHEFVNDSRLYRKGGLYAMAQYETTESAVETCGRLEAWPPLDPAEFRAGTHPTIPGCSFELEFSSQGARYRARGKVVWVEEQARTGVLIRYYPIYDR